MKGYIYFYNHVEELQCGSDTQFNFQSGGNESVKLCVLFYLLIDLSGIFNIYPNRNTEIFILLNIKNYKYIPLARRRLNESYQIWLRGIQLIPMHPVHVFFALRVNHAVTYFITLRISPTRTILFLPRIPNHEKTSWWISENITQKILPQCNMKYFFIIKL